ncbi:MAG: DUF1700 domain-containing protein [Coriobacteriia bacterium]|nr:DUF1700 domain-containing protein [Coriobacteriia bacterium]
MTAAEYLYELRKRLKKLPPQEIDLAMGYYEEYFAEAGSVGEEDLINRLGTPAQVASAIISEFAMKDMSSEGEAQSGSSIKTMWIVIIAVLASPIAIPLAIALLCVVFSLLIALLAIFLALFVVALILVTEGVVTIGISIIGFFTAPVEAIAIMGSALIFLSLGAALGIGVIKLCQLTVKGITWIFAKILERKGGQK